MPLYRVYGADRDSGVDMSLDVNTDSEAEATGHAMTRMLVSDVHIISERQPHRNATASSMGCLMTLSLVATGVSLVWAATLTWRASMLEDHFVVLDRDNKTMKSQLKGLSENNLYLLSQFEYVRRLAINATEHAHTQR